MSKKLSLVLLVLNAAAAGCSSEEPRRGDVDDEERGEEPDGTEEVDGEATVPAPLDPFEGSGTHRAGPIGSDNGNVLACTGVLVGAPAVLCVDTAAAAGGNGTAAAPYRTMASAITAAKAGDTLQIAQGTYLENPVIGALGNGNSKRLDFLGGFQSGSGFTVRNQGAYKTIIDGNLANPALRLFVNAGANNMTVDGLAFKRGRGLGSSWSNGYGHGGGLYVQWYGSGTLTVSHCEMFDNQTNSIAANSQMGGGAWAITQGTGSVRFEDNHFTNNRGGKGAGVAAQGRVHFYRNRVEGNLGQGDHGGGMILYVTGSQIEDNLIKNNRAGILAGYGWGGGVVIAGGSADMRRNVVTGNITPLIGAGVFWDEQVVGTMTNDLIYKNACPNDGRSGAAVYIDGAGASGPGSHVTMTNVTIADHDCPNQAGGGGSVFLERQSTVTIKSSIFWGNTVDAAGANGTTIAATYSRTSLAGTGNITANPLFVDAANNDYHLASTAGHFTNGGWVVDGATSPAIDAGDPASPFTNEPSPSGSRVNLGAYGNTIEASKSATLDYEACPGQPYALGFGQTQNIAGNAGTSSDDEAACGTTSGDRVYRFTLGQAGGIFRASVDAGAVAVRTTCDSAAGELCGQDLTFEATSTVHYVVVEGSGAFNLTVDYETSVCGDGFLASTEECEPPTAFCVPAGQAGECTSTAPDAAADTCPGKSVAVAAGVTTLTSEQADLTTIDYADDLAGSCSPMAGGQDYVLSLTPAVTGTLTVRVGYDAQGELACDSNTCSASCWDVVLSARASCSDVGSELDCANDNAGGEELTLPVTAGVPVSVIVDGVNAGWYAKGAFDLRLELVAD